VPGIDKTTDYVVVNSSNDGTLTINASIFTLGSSGDRLAIFVHNGSTLPSSVGTLRYMVLR
jgi:hypothetical protein